MYNKKRAYKCRKILEQTASLKKKCGYLDLLYRRVAKVGAKVGVATFYTGLLPCSKLLRTRAGEPEAEPVGAGCFWLLGAGAA